MYLNILTLVVLGELRSFFSLPLCGISNRLKIFIEMHTGEAITQHPSVEIQSTNTINISHHAGGDTCKCRLYIVINNATSSRQNAALCSSAARLTCPEILTFETKDESQMRR